MKHKSKIVLISIACAVLFLVSEMEMGTSAVTASKAITSQGQIVSSTGTVYWRAGFETGTDSEFTTGGAGGQWQVEHGGATAQAVNSGQGYPIYKGNWCFKATVTGPPTDGGSVVNAKAIVWSPLRTTIDKAYYGAALYIPTNVSAPDWGINIMQLHVMSDEGVTLPAVLLLSGTAENLKFNLYSRDWNGGEHMWWTSTSPAIVGQWFTAVFYWDGSSANGNLTLWINGVQMTSINSDFRIGNAVNSNGQPVDPSGWVGPFFDTGIYQSTAAPINQYILSDEMIVASTLSAATPTP